MSKYLQVFKISFSQEFAYKVSFIMWRVRNVIQIFMVFFLWNSVFSQSGRTLFGYDRSKILTYIFGMIMVKALVLSSRSIDIAGDISKGDFSNYLLKPINFFKYWFTRDVASKSLNISFAFVESILLYLILKPPFFIQGDLLLLLAFMVSIVLAVLIYTLIIFLTNSVPFWVPEASWGIHFIVGVVIVESLSGVLFPLDILPAGIQNVIYLTPFPYLIFFPIQIYLGKISGLLILKGIIISFIWLIVLWLSLNIVWKKGLKAYQSYGR